MGAQWLAWRLRLPSILLLLVFGLLAGPVTGWIKPDALLGDLLFPLVGISVGLILAEGGLSLRFSELKTTGHVVRNLVSIGALITWAIAAAAAHWLLGLDLPLAFLLGAILVVSGPTVVGPLLREVRPTSQVSAILKWEGIVIDPVGAAFTLLVFEAIRTGKLQHSVVVVAGGILRTIFNELAQKFAAGARVETTRLTKESDYNAFQMHYQQQAVSMFLITQAGELMAFATDSRLRPQPGQSLISLVPATQSPLNSLSER
ncbi:MAG: cation:proton antiporter domain-containing protein [Anaerolineae bacterium]